MPHHPPAIIKELKTSDGPMKISEYLPVNGSTPKGAMIVIQEAFGVNDHIEDVTSRFAQLGYHSVAPHIFHREGDPIVSYGDVPSARAVMASLSDEGMAEDIEVTINYLTQYFPNSKIGIVGFCMGGRTTFLAAERFALGGAVSFYGGGIVSGRSEKCPSLIGDIVSMKTPWLGLFGDLDDSIPVDEVENLRSLLKNAPVETKIIRYPEAKHGFHCDQRPTFYHEETAKQAWAETVNFFASHLG